MHLQFGGCCGIHAIPGRFPARTMSIRIRISSLRGINVAAQTRQAVLRIVEWAGNANFATRTRADGAITTFASLMRCLRSGNPGCHFLAPPSREHRIRLDLAGTRPAGPVDATSDSWPLSLLSPGTRGTLIKVSLAGFIQFKVKMPPIV
jgi:hypothetical protein